MDLRFPDERPTDAERHAVDAVLGPPPSSWEGGWRTADDLRAARGGHAARSQRHLLLPALHALNDRVGWISRGGLTYVCERLTVPPADAYGVATFYALLPVEPRPPRVAHVCVDAACQVAGSAGLVAALEAAVGPAGATAPTHDGRRARPAPEPGGPWPGPAGSLPPDPGCTWVPSPCLGLCERAPAAVVTVAGAHPSGDPVAPADARALTAVLRGDASAPAWDPVAAVPQAGDPSLVLLRRVGVVDPASLDSYRMHGGYEALRRALALGPAGVLRELLDSGLVGRGGAAFPTGRKWDAVARQPARPHYVVCNADESEPGTFKDRVLLECDPFSVVEAITIAGLTTGCEQGFVYLRGEYHLAHEQLSHAISEARHRGLLGDDVMGSGRRFDLEVRRGTGAYVCGEETAIFNSIEGYRGEPRNKPPFPVESGLFGKPTVVNNVETLVNVLPILLGGGPAFAAVGTGRAGSTGTKLFCLSGSVARPGVYEVPFGPTVRDLIAGAGGVPGDRSIQAVLLGGAAGGFLRPDELDVPLTFEGTRAAGVALGSGVVMVFDDTVVLAPVLQRIAAFFREESCGQCVPCRVGTLRQEEAIERLAAGAPLGSVDDDLALLADLGRVMRDASICGLGQTASSAIESALAKFALFGAHEGGRP